MGIKKSSDKQLRFLSGRVTEVMTERIRNEVPRKGAFQTLSVSFQIPSTNNVGYMFIENSLTGTAEQRRLKIGVCRNGRDRLHSYYLLHETNDKIIEYLNSDGISETLAANFKTLSDRVDDDD